MISKIVSGGQTGVDTAALDVAIEFKIPHGGWCPKGRFNEEGIISNKYTGLKEVVGPFKNERENYSNRTELNIRDSDGTLVLVPQLPIPKNIKDGTLLTITKTLNNPQLIIDLSLPDDKNIALMLRWIKHYKIKILNIGGPRESSWPGIYKTSLSFLKKFLLALKESE